MNVNEPNEDEDTVEVGACYEDDDDGEIARVTATEPDVSCVIVRESANTWRARACAVGFAYDYRDAAHFRGTYTKRVADPTPAIAVLIDCSFGYGTGTTYDGYGPPCGWTISHRAGVGYARRGTP